MIIIRNNEIILKTEKIFQNDNKEINTEEINKITIRDNKFIYESRKHENDQHGVNTKKVNVSKACKNERFMLLNIIMMILHRHVKKCAKKKKIETNEKVASNTTEGISKPRIVSNTSVGIFTAKITINTSAGIFRQR